MRRKRWYWLALIMIFAPGEIGANRFYAVRTDAPACLLAALEHGELALQAAAGRTLAAVTNSTARVASVWAGHPLAHPSETRDKERTVVGRTPGTEVN